MVIITRSSSSKRWKRSSYLSHPAQRWTTAVGVGCNVSYIDGAAHHRVHLEHLEHYVEEVVRDFRVLPQSYVLRDAAGEIDEGRVDEAAVDVLIRPVHPASWTTRLHEWMMNG